MMPKKMCAFTNRLRKWLGCGKNRQTGFTLLELILSIAILSAVLVTIYATLSMGSRTWDKGERDIEKVQRMRVVMDALRKRPDGRLATDRATHRWVAETLGRGEVLRPEDRPAAGASAAGGSP